MFVIRRNFDEKTEGVQADFRQQDYQEISNGVIRDEAA